MVSFTIMMSTIFNSPSVIALISILVLLGLKVLVGLSHFIDYINPANMSKHAMGLLITGTMDTKVIGNVLIVAVLIVLTLLGTNFWISNKKFNTE